MQRAGVESSILPAIRNFSGGGDPCRLRDLLFTLQRGRPAHQTDRLLRGPDGRAFVVWVIIDLKLDSFTEAAPAVLTILLMPLASSISEGLALGFLLYAALTVATGGTRRLTWIAWLLAGLFALRLVIQ